jgi:hypothetical protein
MRALPQRLFVFTERKPKCRLQNVTKCVIVNTNFGRQRSPAMHLWGRLSLYLIILTIFYEDDILPLSIRLLHIL